MKNHAESLRRTKTMHSGWYFYKHIVPQNTQVQIYHNKIFLNLIYVCFMNKQNCYVHFIYIDGDMYASPFIYHIPSHD